MDTGTHGAAPDPDVVLVDGPWTHRTIRANGMRFHAAELGSGPLVLLLHGFPENWWSWRRQLADLASAGFRAVAVDLRGYGASDKPPRGYDAYTLTADVAGLVRALGATDAVIVGSDWGGLLAWSVAALHPTVVRGLAVISMPHPVCLPRALLAPRQARASWYVAAAQVPGVAESRLVADGAALVGRALRTWSGPAWPRTADFAEAERRYREAVLIPGTAHSALEYYRWSVRSLVRPSGVRFLRAAAANPVGVPVLQVHGTADGCLLPRSVHGSERYVRGAYHRVLMEGIGHFPHEEAPEQTSALIADLAARAVR